METTPTEPVPPMVTAVRLAALAAVIVGATLFFDNLWAAVLLAGLATLIATDRHG